jgi:hypothetical protein
MVRVVRALLGVVALEILRRPGSDCRGFIWPAGFGNFGSASCSFWMNILKKKYFEKRHGSIGL